MKPKPPPRDCELCGVVDAVRGNRYCKKCGRAVLLELQQKGYLSDSIPPKPFSDERGRKGLKDPKTLGGSAEMGGDGDDW